MLNNATAQNTDSSINTQDFAYALQHSSQQEGETTQATSQKLTPKRKKILIALVSFFVVLGLSIVALGFYTYSVVADIKQQTQVLQADGQQAYTFFKEQNLPAVETTLNKIATDFAHTKSTYEKLSFYSYIPIARNYYNDGMHGMVAGEAGLSAAKKSIAAVTPYADVLGLGGETKFQGGTTEDRLKVLLETLDKISPILDEIAKDLKTVESELLAINASRYPETANGINVRENIIAAQNFSTSAVTALTEFRPVLEELPSVAGARGERKKYIILFQNDNELRPTGGFLTAYAIINVENGKVEAEKSGDIYELDQKFSKKLPIPPELGRYLTTEKIWHLRDMNISPDFKLAMDQFYENYKTVPGEPETVDGIIAVDTHFLTNLMRVLGPVEVPGYGTFSAENDPRCDCPQIIYVLSEIITKPTPYIRENRKGIIGPLMRSLLTKAYTAPKQSWPELFKTGFSSIQNKHAQFYFLDEKAQSAAQLVEVAGRMVAPTDNSDFLGIINANLGGAKSNLFIDYSVKQIIAQAPVDGMLEKTVEITYKNNHKADNCDLEAGQLCLNSTLRDWTRLYVPQGSTLVSAEGFLEDARTYDENGFTVFDGFFTLEPLGSSKLTITYKVPYTNTTDYTIKLWKQGGIEMFETLMDVTGGQEMIQVTKDMSYSTFF